MTSPREPDRPRDYEVPCVMQPPMEFDMAADHDLSSVPAGDKYSLCDVNHPPMEFDAAAVWITLTFRFDPAAAPEAAGPEVAGLVRGLDAYDRTLGGRGLFLDRDASSEAAGRLDLMLRPVDPTGAAERFRRVAEVLGCPLHNGVPPPSAGPGPLPEAVARTIEAPTTPPTELDDLRERIHKNRVGLWFAA